MATRLYISIVFIVFAMCFKEINIKIDRLTTQFTILTKELNDYETAN